MLSTKKLTYLGRINTFVFIFLICNAFSFAKTDSKRVLLIHSYNYGFPTTANMIRGVHTVFDTCNIKVDIEFMDWKRLPIEQNTASFFNSILMKIKNTKPYDAIITSDDVALIFALKNQEDLFKNKPIIFSGVNNNLLALQQNKNNWVTGVAESVSMKENIDLMIHLFPESKKMYCIADNTLTGQSDLKLFESYTNQYPNHEFEIIDLKKITFKDLPQSLKSIPETSPVLLISAYNDKNNTNYEFEESFSLIKQELKSPIFHLYYHGIGKGIIGGKLVSHYELGKSAARLVTKVFNGTPIDNIPVIMQSPNKYIFDYNELNRFNISVSNLPENATILNNPTNFYEINKKLILFIIIFLIIQTSLIIYLIRLNIERKRAEKKLQQKASEHHRLNEEYSSLNEELMASLEELERSKYELETSEELYRLTLKASNDGYWDWNLITNNVFFSARWKEIIGYEDNELINEFSSWKNNVHEDDIENALKKVEAFIAGSDERYEVEFRMRHKKGHYIHILAKGLLMRNSNDVVYRIVGTHQDLTERYKYEFNLKKQIEENLSLYEEYRTLSDELFIKNNNLLATEEELRANNEELYYKNEKIAESEEKYRLLFENMSAAFALHKIILDENGNPCNYLFVEFNEMFEKLTGLKKQDTIGKTVLDVLPNTEKYWIETYGKVALTGKPHHFTNYSKELDKHFEIQTYSPKQNYFAVTFNDVTNETNTKLQLLKSFEDVKIKEKLFQDMFNSSPVVMIILNQQTEIININKTGLTLANKEFCNVIGHQGGDYLSCINAIKHPKGCGHSEDCNECILRNSIKNTLSDNINTNKIEFELTTLNISGEPEIKNFLVSSTLLSNSNEKQVLVCLEDVSILKRKEIQLVKRNHEVQQLLFGAKEILTINDFYKTTNDLFNSCLNISEATSGFVGVMDETGIKILHLNKDGQESNLEREMIIPNNDWFNNIFMNQEIVVENNFSSEYLPQSHFKIKNAIFAPIVVKNKVEGIFVLANKNGIFNNEDKNIIGAFTELAALSLNNTITNQKIEESETKFRTSFQISPDSISINTFDRKYVNINNGFTELLGYTEEEVVNKTSKDFSLWVDHNKRQYWNNELKEKGFIKNLETEFKAKDGSIKTVLISSTTIQLDDKPHILSITRDITHLKLQRYYLEKAQEIGKIGTWHLDITNNILTWTKETYKIFGLSPKEELSMEIFKSFLHPEDKEYVLSEWNSAINGKPYEIEHRIIVDGKIKWVRQKADIEYNERNEAKIGIGVTQDITQEKTQENTLKKLNSDINLIYEYDPAFIILKDTKNNIIRVSNKVAEMTGLPKENIEGRPSEEIYPEHAEKYYLDDLEVINSKEPKLGIIEELVDINGERQWLLTDKIPIIENEKVKSIILFSTDITELKRSELILQEKNREFEALNEKLKKEKINVEKAQEIGKVGSWSYNIQENKLLISKQCYHIFELTEDSQIDTELIFSMIHPNDIDNVRKQWEKGLNGTPFSIECKIILKDKEKWIFFKSEIDRISGQKNSQIVGVAIDITERKHSEWQIKQVNKRFEGLENIITYKAHSIHDLLDHTLKNVIKYTNSDFGAVYHYDKNKQIFFLNNWSEDVSLTVDIAIDENKINCLSKAVKTKNPVILNGNNNSYPFISNKNRNQSSLKSLTIPILDNNEIVAVFWVASNTLNFQDFHAKQVMLLLETTWIIVEKQKLQLNSIKIS